MKRSILLLLMLVLVSGLFAKPDEGMWIPSRVAEMIYSDMKNLGLKLTPEEIYSYNNSSIKDAIFQLQNADGSGFCTAEIVSKQGLLFTNHHCAYPAIADASTVEANYLDDGFWARAKIEEIPLPDLRVSRVVRIEDVTSRVLEEVTDTTTQSDRDRIVQKVMNEIKKEATEDNHYTANVYEFYQGGEYFLYVYEIFGDVRLVGAPPSSIGKFGGDTDNWMWPRHTGDFAVLRVYMSPDGKPTKKYEEDNIPYQPLHSLPISIRGFEKGDFAMIMGFPGVTERFLSSYGMIYKRDYFNPVVVDLLKVKIDVMLEEMQKDDAVRLAYSNTYAGLANGHKLFTGERLTLLRSDAIQQKEDYEKEFMNWVNADEYRQEKYGDVLNNLKEQYETFGPIAKEMIYLSLGLLQSSDMVMEVRNFMTLNRLLEDAKKNESSIKAVVGELIEGVEEMFDDYFPKVDMRILSTSLKFYLENMPEEKRSRVFEDFIFADYKGGLFRKRTEEQMVDAFVEDVYENSIFTSKERMIDFLNNPRFRTLDRDPMYKFTQTIFGGVMGIQMKYLGAMENIGNNERLFIEAMRLYEPDRLFYPDANSTLRLTYGTVKSYIPRDAVYYKHVTYIDGVIEKKDPNHFEFVVPERLVELYEKQDFGRYVDHTGNLPVNFLTDNDITGGNSGSPVINAKGELIGIAFDGNWEWLCSNLIYSPELQRTINVDARYVLWVIDKLYGAHNIIDELDIRE